MRKARKLWLAVHLWIALIFGGVVVMIALTGSALVFYLEIDRLLNPELEIAAAPGERQSAGSDERQLARGFALPAAR
jgi:uncharacterized iron-regulated membrane protein